MIEELFFCSFHKCINYAFTGIDLNRQPKPVNILLWSEICYVKPVKVL